MADTKTSAETNQSAPVLADYAYSVIASGPTSARITFDRLLALSNPLFTTGRLTLATKNAAPKDDQLAKGTLYYTSISNNDGVLANNFQIVLYDGTRLALYSSAEISLSLTGLLTNATPHDVFIYDNAGTLTLEVLAWTNATTRATALAAQSGLLVKTGATTRRYVGTLYATGTGTTADSGGLTGTTQVGATRFLWNAYNQVERPMRVIDTADSWTWGTASFHRANAASGQGNTCEWVVGDINAAVTLDVVAGAAFATNDYGTVGVGIDSSTVQSAQAGMAFNGNAVSITIPFVAKYRGYPGLGYHYGAWIEKAASGTSITFDGDGGGDGRQAGMSGYLVG